MNRVFIVKNQRQVNHVTGRLVDKFDFSPAEDFGDLVYLLDPEATPFDLPPVMRALGEKLADFDDGDYLLLTGNPVLLGLAVAVAAYRNHGSVTMLQWSGAHKRYLPVKATDIYQLWAGEEGGDWDGEDHY